MKVGGLEVGEAVRGGELEAGRGAAGRVREAGVSCGEEDGDAGDEQGLREALDDGVDQGAKVGLRVERAAEVDEGFAVVEAASIEEAVDPGLDGALEGIKDEAGGDDDGEQAPDAGLRLAGGSGRFGR